MLSFNLTPQHKLVPSISNWGNSSEETLVSDQNESYTESLRQLEYEYKIRSPLNPNNVFDNVWPTALLREIAIASYPLRDLLDGKLGKLTVNATREWLCFWEIYARCIIPTFIQRLKARLEATKDKARNRAKERKIVYEEKDVPQLKGVPLRSFHIHDVTNTIQPMQKAVSKIEYESSVQLNWDWMAVYDAPTEVDRLEINKNLSKWVVGVSGDTGFSVPNMRAWKNKIAVGLKTADIIVDNSNTEDKTSGIAFSLMNLAPGGSTVLYLPKISSTAHIAMIHLFSHCFEYSEIIHTQAEDRLFLHGSGFLNNLNAKHIKLLYTFCDNDPGDSNQTPFSHEYVTGDEFMETIATIITVNTAVHAWRYEYYEKVLLLNQQLVKSASARTFDHYQEQFLEENYPDQSKKWAHTVGFNFLAQDSS